MHRSTVGLALGLLHLLAAVPPASAGEPIRAIAPAPEGADPYRAILDAAGAVRVRPGSDGDARVVLLGDSAAGLFDDGAVAALDASVRGGLGLVVVGEAAAALPRSEPFSRLLGRRRVHPAGAREGKPLPVAVLGQEHPLTECLTHLALERTSLAASGADEVEDLAVAPLDPGEVSPGGPEGFGSFAPVVWCRRHGSGRVVVVGLRAEGRPETREASLAVALAARAIQLAADRAVTVPFPADLPLAVEARAAGTKGLPGIPELEGYHLGRRIAPVMSHRGSDWLLRPDREETEEPEKVIDALRIGEGSRVVDLGAGVGYFTLRLARRVGAAGQVIAIDIQEPMLAGLRKRSEEAGLRNIATVLATERDPGLGEGPADLVLMVDVYHELSRPDDILGAVLRALRRDPERPGRLALVEYRGEDPTVPIQPFHRVTQDQVRAELEAAGFHWIETHEFLRHQRILVFRAAEPPPGPAGVPRAGASGGPVAVEPMTE